jgi:hypothetical protein
VVVVYRKKWEVRNMASDTDDTIRAKLVAKMHRNGFYEPSGVSIDGLANLAVAGSDQGRAKELVHEMARADACPVIYKRVDASVMLEVDSQDWVAAYIRRNDPDQLTWDLE